MLQKEPLYIALHVPKCAGTSVETHMREHLAAENIWITKKREGSLPSLSGRPYAMRDDTGEVRFVGGHYIGKSIESCFPGRRIMRSVLLREPLSFHLSYYNYRSMRYLSQGLKTYTFDDHIRSQPDDPISHFLLQRWHEIPRAKLLSMPAARKYDILNTDLAKFWFVGDLSSCNDLMTLLSEAFGISTDIKAKNTKDQWQNRVAWTMLTRDQLTPAQIDMVARRTMLDRALWETWKSARFDAASVVPVPLPAEAGRRLALHELQRPYSALVRRLKRSWN